MSSKELDEIEVYIKSLMPLSLGELVDRLILFRIEDQICTEDESLTEKSERFFRINALKKEITRRVEPSENRSKPGTGGVSSLGSLLK